MVGNKIHHPTGPGKDALVEVEGLLPPSKTERLVAVTDGWWISARVDSLGLLWS
ncbi:hypothetical protein [Nocardiopsis sp. NPDC057823]|uniref:hypothetical protein n=1 Tax=Nocardiopsis sp. NPDC057823 TaxID=3346256 RepID=UPI00366E75DD